MSNNNIIHETRSRDFSDIVQGEDLEFRNSDDQSFPINHKIEQLGRISPPPIMSHLSTNQLITIAGAASGFLAGVVVCPLDVVKTKLQAQGLKNGKYRGLTHTVKTILREEGIKGLYRGLVPITIGYLPTWTIYFTVYERAKRFYPQFLEKELHIVNPSIIHFFSALTAGMASSIAVNPIWVVKTRLMVQNSQQKHKYNGTLDAFKKMYQQEGFRVFYSGLVPSLFGLLHVGIHFPAYEKLKKLFNCNNQVQNRNSGLLWRLIGASSISKMIASTITYPHEILRTRMQIRNEHGVKKLSFIKTIISVYHHDGLKGFYAGYLTNLARTVPASAVTLVSFEYFKTYLLEISGKIKKQ